jgi:hypothetical protein
MSSSPLDKPRTESATTLSTLEKLKVLRKADGAEIEIKNKAGTGQEEEKRAESGLGITKSLKEQGSSPRVDEIS